MPTTGYSRNADPVGLARIGQQGLQEFLCQHLMLVLGALDQRDGACEQGAVAGTYTVNVILQLEVVALYLHGTHEERIRWSRDR